MPPTDVFRPRLPLDPFQDAVPPWRVDIDLPPSESHSILVLGAPSHADLAPLALSPHLASSLVVIATHTPPPVPDPCQCAVIILHLPAPLDIHDSGAVRLASLLDRAQRVAHSWHSATTSQPRIQQFAELYPGGDFTMAEQPELALTAPLPPPRQESDDNMSLSSSLLPPKKPSVLKGQSTFSALINFLPATLPDKALLKHAILVTTLSAPFLAPHQPPSPYKRQSFFSSISLSSNTDTTTPKPERRRSRIASLFSRADAPPSSYSTPPSLFTSSRAPSSESLTLPQRKPPHLIHVLPYSASAHPHPHRSSTAPTPSSLNPNRRSHLYSHTHPKSKLVQSIEQFLLSFAYPPSASASSPSLSVSASALTSLSPPTPPPHPAHRPLPRSSPLASPSASPGGSPSSSFRTPTPNKRSSSILHSPAHNMSMSMSMSPNPTPIPYLLPAGALGAYPHSSTHSIGEMILLGALDGVASGTAGGAERQIGGNGRVKEVEGWPRAWIGGRGEVVLERPSAPPSPLTLGPGIGIGGGVEGGDIGKGKGKVVEEVSPVKGKKRVRRNEAGLPTPPESSSSSDGEDEDGRESGSEASHDGPPSRYVASEQHFSLMEAGEVHPLKKKGKLRTRVSRFFGWGRGRDAIRV